MKLTIDNSDPLSRLVTDQSVNVEREENNLTFFKNTCKRSFDARFIRPVNSKYLLVVSISDNYLLGVYDLQDESGFVTPNSECYLEDLNGFSHISLVSVDVSPSNPLLNTEDTSESKMETLAKELLKQIISSEQHGNKSPTTQAVLAIQLADAFYSQYDQLSCLKNYQG